MTKTTSIIDIGSNTIVLAIYEIHDKNLKLIENMSQAKHLVGYIENGKMQQEGIEAAYETVKEYMDILSLRNIDDVHADITECGRNISNQEELIHAVERAGCKDVRILTGHEEAMSDYYGAALSSSLNTGILIDIGGGSTEFVSFENKKATAAHSIPLGCVRLKQMPYTPDTSAPSIKDMRAHYPMMKDCTDAIGIGGTIRYTTYAIQKLYGIGESFTIEQAKDFYKRLQDEETEARNVLYSIADPDRASVILPGMGMLIAAMDSFNIKVIHKSECGVREGYLAHYIHHLV